VCLGFFFIPQAGWAQSPYAGTERCNDCHGKEANLLPQFGNPWANWLNTGHSQIYRDPDQPATGRPNDTTGVVPVDDFKAGLNLTTNAKFSRFGANAPILGYDAAVGTSKTDTTSGYTVTIDNITYTVHRVHGGTRDEWKQRFHTKIGKSFYVLPIQYNIKTQAWTDYNPQHWYDLNTNLPLYNDPATLTTDIIKANAEDRNCIGCHGVGPQVEFNATTGEWIGNPVEWNIGCEACHGPGGPPSHTLFGLSGQGANPAKLTDLERQVDVCGQCHSRGASTASIGGKTLGYPYKEGEGVYKIGQVLSEFFNLVNPTANPNDFWFDALPYGNTSKSHHQQAQDFKLSAHAQYDPNKPWVNLVCSTCHDPHGNTSNKWMIRNQLVEDGVTIATENDDNTLCLACHAGHGPFASLRKTTIANITDADSLALVASVVSGHTRHSYDPENNNTTSGSSRCSKCHSPKVQKTAIEYDIHAHTFWTIAPSQTLDSQAQGGMPNSCAVSCHRNGTGNVPNFGIADATLSAWNEQTDVDLATELKFWDENMFFKERGNIGVAVSALPAVAAPVINADTSDWNDVDWVEAALADNRSISMKGKISGNNLYLLFRWADPTMSMVRGESWVWDGAQWNKNPGQSEDRVSVMWNIDIPEEQWEKDGCMNKCHFDVNNPVAPDSDPEDDSYLAAGQHADLWHMKPARGLAAISAQQSGTVVIDPATHQATAGTFQLVGFLDDQTMKEYVGKPDGGRVGDAGSSAESRNRNAAQTGPLYIEKNPVDYIDAMVLTQAEIDGDETAKVDSISVADLNTYWANYAALNAVVPERFAKTPSGSRGDIHAAGLWHEGVWYVEIERALNTGNADDASFVTNGVSKFGVALMDNAGGEEHWTQGSVLNKLGVGIVVSVPPTPRAIPSQYALFQNYPNPFNPSTTIRFNVKRAGWVTLKVYNTLGQEVATLVDDRVDPGAYQITYNAITIPSGLYFYRLSVNGFSEVRKMVVLK
jgi:hypothetical protein